MPGPAPMREAGGVTTPNPGEPATLSVLFARMAEQVFSRLPLYRRLAEGAAHDPEVASRLHLARADQRVPNLLFAAVHDVLLTGREDLLADWYPTVTDVRGGAPGLARPVGPGADDPWPHFRRLALEDREVADRLRTRATQTNEVGRALALLPALFHVARSSAEGSGTAIRPLGLVEIGASAGLNLGLEAYGYRYVLAAPGPDQVRSADSIGSAARLLLECDLRGPLVPPLPQGALPIETAVGLDRAPLLVTDADDARWLLACQWPEETDRVARLRKAIELAQHSPPQVEVGDAVDDVARHLLQVPGHALPVVVSTWVMAYLPEARQRALLHLLDAVGSQRDLALVYAEQPETIPGVPVPPRPDGGRDGRATALVAVEWRAGQRRETRLGDLHPHGRWLEWMHERPTATDLEDAGGLPGPEGAAAPPT